MMPSAPVVLLTGASGLVGGETLRLIRSTRPELTIHTLGRSADSTIQADLTSPDLPELPSEVTHILHCAADTRFGRPLAEICEINVVGTERLIQRAARCPHLRAFVHVSTSFVCGRQAGVIPEALLERPVAFSNTYQESKWAAECVVSDAMSRLPMAIARVSSVFGHSETGEVRQYNYTHQLLKFLGRNVLPVAPVDVDVPVDLVPSDWVAASLDRFLFEDHTAGTVRHVCAGALGSLPAGEMIRRAVAAYESLPAGERFLPVRLPEFVSLAEYEKFAAGARAGKDRLLREVVRVLDFFLPHLAIRQEFAVGKGRSGAPPAGSYFDKVAAWCLSRNWGLHA